MLSTRHLAPDALDDDYSDLVSNPADRCPECGEAEIDSLVWDDDSTFITCATCSECESRAQKIIVF